MPVLLKILRCCPLMGASSNSTTMSSVQFLTSTEMISIIITEENNLNQMMKVLKNLRLLESYLLSTSLFPFS